MPVGAVGAGRDGDGAGDLGQRVGAGAVPEGDAAAREVDLVRDVVPDARLEGHVPLRLAVGVPAERVVRGAGRAGDQAILELGEVGLCGAMRQCSGWIEERSKKNLPKKATWCSCLGLGAFSSLRISEKW